MTDLTCLSNTDLTSLSKKDLTSTEHISLDVLPPSDVLLSLMDTYFSHVHNRPYAFFHERTFMDQLRVELYEQMTSFVRNTPERIYSCLLLAICAFSVRFSPHPAFVGRTVEASEAYSRAAWKDVMENHLSSDAYQSLQAIQCVAILAIVDYTAGQVSAGWLRLGLAIRMAQEAGMMQEPPPSLPVIEREARRRTWWSIYLVDKFISCAKSRPSTIWETDCLLRLPSDPLDFGANDEVNNDGSPGSRNDSIGIDVASGTTMSESLDQLLHWHTDLSATHSLSVFGLTILMVSVLGRCARYMYGRMADHLPPWDPKSETVAIRTSLGRIEQLLRTRTEPSPGVPPRDAAIQTSRIVYTHCMFHLCHCLLNHPFLLRKRLQSTVSRIPPAFIMQAFSTVEQHACKLTDLLDSAWTSSTSSSSTSPTSFDTLTMDGTQNQPVSSIFAYCAMIAAGVHILSHGHRNRQAFAALMPLVDNVPQQQRKDSSTAPQFGQYDTNDYFLRSRQFIQKLEALWPMVVNIETRLDYLVLSTDVLPDLFDTTCLMDELDSGTEDYLWSITDYGALARYDTLLVKPGE
ncbi:hypothetical protein SEUCBS139899_008868 [Sporothrix eucalyptigena]